MHNDELHDGQRRRLIVECEMLTGRAHHVIYFTTPEQGLKYPEWAQGRREEIIARINPSSGSLTTNTTAPEAPISYRNFK
jgi:hypothetical protein